MSVDLLFRVLNADTRSGENHDEPSAGGPHGHAGLADRCAGCHGGNHHTDDCQEPAASVTCVVDAGPDQILDFIFETTLEASELKSNETVHLKAFDCLKKSDCRSEYTRFGSGLKLNDAN